MENKEQKLSDFIDRLNEDLRPDEDEHTAPSEELRELYRTVRLVRSLREPTMPDGDFLERLTKSVAAQVQQQKRAKKRKTWSWAAAAAAMAAALVLWMNLSPLMGGPNIVHAMEEAFREVEAYHGVLEIVTTTADGNTTLQSKLDVWADKAGRYVVEGLEGAQEGFVTANDGKRKWQIRPKERQVHLFPAVPDAYRVKFEIGHEIEEAKMALSTRVVGDDEIAGRPVTVLEVTPDGGLPYHLWVDEETKLPLRKQTAMQHAVQYTYTYTQIEFAEAIPGRLLAYQLPEGFEEIAESPEQVVLDASEAEAIAGFAPVLPEALPDGYVQERISVLPETSLVRIYYRHDAQGSQVIVTQGRAAGEFAPNPNAAIGRAGDLAVEVLSSAEGDISASSIRWQQDGIEFTVLGRLSVDQLAAFAQSWMDAHFMLPEGKDEEAFPKPQVEVEYDPEAEKSDQKNADAGSAPWKLDPVFVAQVFVSLQMMPDGISGDEPVAYEDLEIMENNGVQAIIAVHDEDAPIARVFVERVVRQDDTGIWTVVGYDPR